MRVPTDPGFTLIELMIVIAIIAIIAAIAIPNLLDARKSGNESAAISSLRTLVSAQAIFRQNDLDGDTIDDYGSLADLHTAGLIDGTLESGVKSGYLFALETQPAPSWWTTGDPASSDTGTRHFYVDETGIIRFNNSRTAGPADTPIEWAAAPAAAASGDATTTILELNGLAGGAALPLAEQLLQNSTVADIVLNELDADASSTLELSEVLGADLLGIARRLVPILVGQDPGPSIGSDDTVRTLADAHLSFLTADLEVGLYNEEEVSVPSTGLPGDAHGLLASLLAAAVPAVGLLWGAAGMLAGVTLWRRWRRSAPASR